MFAFFYSIYLALFEGTWELRSLQEAKEALAQAWSDVTNWIMNALGGEFTTLQSFTWTANLWSIWALILALVTISLISYAVWKITEAIFSIFFSGAR